ncbi:MAG: hypothetical protein JSW16_06070 [Dehalococcoidales bacterium]|nr:MAG: hypothetical protein JSW16_06070 [Dehalococcoidales bacterium]
MGRSREIENILNECLERMLVQGETVERCVGLYPQHADELRPLLEFAVAAREATVIQPRPEFRDRARYQFSQILRDSEQKARRPLFGWHWRPTWVATVAIFLVLIIAGGGTAAAASGSMPDQALYTVKLITERVQLAFTFTALGKAEAYASMADKRVDEIVYLAGEGESAYIERATERLDSYLSEIAALSSPRLMAGAVLEESQETDEMMAAVVEEEVAEEEEEAAIAEDTLTIQKTSPLGGEIWSEEGLRSVSPEARVWQTIIVYNHPSRLRAALDTAPSSVRSALMQALYISQVSYDQAIEYLE